MFEYADFCAGLTLGLIIGACSGALVVFAACVTWMANAMNEIDKESRNESPIEFHVESYGDSLGNSGSAW